MLSRGLSVAAAIASRMGELASAGQPSALSMMHVPHGREFGNINKHGQVRGTPGNKLARKAMQGRMGKAALR